MPAKTAVKSDSIKIVTAVPPKKNAFGKEDVIECLSAIISADVCACYDITDGNVTVKDFRRIPPGTRFAVSSIKNGTAGRGAEIQFYDKLKALDMLCKCLGIYSPENDDTEIMSRLDDVLDNII